MSDAQAGSVVTRDRAAPGRTEAAGAPAHCDRVPSCNGCEAAGRCGLPTECAGTCPQAMSCREDQSLWIAATAAGLAITIGSSCLQQNFARLAEKSFSEAVRQGAFARLGERNLSVRTGR